ncbi:MAG: type II toxin-antitoxin system HicB family antitoxin [Dehalococcoidia bacterium]|nr:type II toxin-antitoxin system HicB family antitoxin [Dehalococcoidia bacterium]
MKFIVTLEQDEDGYAVASCPALPGGHSQRRGREEAIRGYLISMRKHGETLPVTAAGVL